MIAIQQSSVSLLAAASPEGTALPSGPGERIELLAPGADGGFAPALQRLLDHARQRDVVAQQAVDRFARGDDPGRIHETMVAVSKAEIALRTVAAVRNKLLEAYRDLQHVTA
jgi:flagellar hook-basal body complex protein FliE